MKVVMNIEKKYVYTIVGLLILFAGMFAVNAFGGVDPSVMGHSAGEVDLSSGVDQVGAAQYCDVNGANCLTMEEIVKGIGGTTASTSDYLVNLQHTEDQCTALGGVVVSGMCQFNSASCPSGWAQYGQWSTTVYDDVGITGVDAVNNGVCIAWSGNTYDYTGSTGQNCAFEQYKKCTYLKHSFSNKGVESCSISYTGSAGWSKPCAAPATLTCTAKRTQIGCY